MMTVSIDSPIWEKVGSHPGVPPINIGHQHVSKTMGQMLRRRYVQVSQPRSRSSWKSNGLSPAFVHARDSLRAIEVEYEAQGRRLATPQARRLAGRILREVLAEDSIYPTMSIDEDGAVIAEWLVGGLTLQLDVAPEGVFEWSYRMNGDTLKRSRAVAPLRQSIRSLTKLVDDANPNWRAKFGSRALHSS